VSHKRRVRFSVGSDDNDDNDDNDDDDNDSVQVETFRYQLAPAKCKSRLVWTKHEIKELQEERCDTADFHKTKEDYVACIHHLFAAIRMLSKSPARGLEARVAPILRVHRQWGVTTILATQAKLNKGKVTDREKREKMLRARSLQISKRSRIFAFKLAQGDASEALMAGRRLSAVQ
jgi:hypothetical protein